VDDAWSMGAVRSRASHTVFLVERKGYVRLLEVCGYRLRELREMLALTQTDVSEALGISQKRVSEIERGRVELTKVDTLRRYAEALGGSLRVEVKVGDVIYRIA